MKRLSLFLLMLLPACSGLNSPNLSLPVLLKNHELPFPVKTSDQAIVGDFFLLRDDDNNYVSLVVTSAADERKKYGMDSQALIKQLYGFEDPKVEEIAAAKQMIFSDVIQHEQIVHDSLTAFYLKDKAGVERIYFTEQALPDVYYLLESKGRPVIEIFKGIRRR